MAEQYELVNGYDSKAGVNSGSLEAGTGDKTVIYEDRDSKVYVDANDLTAGSGLKTLMDNGWDAKVVVFATDLVAGSGQKTVMVNGYDSLVIFNPEEEGAGDGDKTKLVNGYDATAVFGLAAAAPPNYDELIQWLTGETEERDGNTYLIDSIGDNVRDPQPGVYTDTGAITQLQFDDLTGLAIDTYQGNGTATISGDNVNITGTEFSSIKFDDGSYYSLEFLDGTTIKGEQSCTVVGTFTTDTTLRYLSYRDLSGYGEEEVTGTGDPEYDENDWTRVGTWIIYDQAWKEDGTECIISTSDAGAELKQYSVSTAYDASTMSLESEISIVLPGGRYIEYAGGYLFTMDESAKIMKRYSFSSGLIEDAVEDQSVSIVGQVNSIRGFNFSDDGLHLFYVYNRGSEFMGSYTLSTAFDLDTRSYNGYVTVSGVTNLDDVWLNNSGSRYYTFDVGTDTVRVYNMSTNWDLTTSDTGATYIDEVSEFAIRSAYVFEDAGYSYTCDYYTIYGLSVPSITTYIPADITDNTIDTDGNAIPEAQQGRIRLDVLLDGTQRTELEASELYIMSQNLTTNILFTGETATAYEEALLEYNQDGAGYMFANITDYPTIGECLKYGVAQTGLLTDEDLHNALDYVDALEVVKDSDGVTVTYPNGDAMTTIKTGVLV